MILLKIIIILSWGLATIVAAPFMIIAGFLSDNTDQIEIWFQFITKLINKS